MIDKIIHSMFSTQRYFITPAGEYSKLDSISTAAVEQEIGVLGMSTEVKKQARWKMILTAIALLSSVVANLYLFHSRQLCYNQAVTKDRSFIGLMEQPLVERLEGYWDPDWDPQLANWTDLDSRWESTHGGFGVVALSHEWAHQKGLIRSTNWPVDSSKGLYVIPVYHALHCLRSLRIYFRHFAHGRIAKHYWIAHGYHCHEVIRQELMCSARDALTGRLVGKRIGEGETRQCADWEYLRGWAAEHSAGYVETEHHEPAYLENGPASGGWGV